MKIFSGIIMLIGAFVTLMEFMGSETAIQQAASVVYVVGAYVTGRALENFAVGKKEQPEQTNRSAVTTGKGKVTVDNYTHIIIKHAKDEPYTISKEEWLKIKKNNDIDDYEVIELIKK